MTKLTLVQGQNDYTNNQLPGTGLFWPLFLSSQKLPSHDLLFGPASACNRPISACLNALLIRTDFNALSGSCHLNH